MQKPMFGEERVAHAFAPSREWDVSRGWVPASWRERSTTAHARQLRLPRSRVSDAGGRPMELAPRSVDVLVTRPMGESYTGRDSQLDAAVSTLLKQIGPAR